MIAPSPDGSRGVYVSNEGRQHARVSSPFFFFCFVCFSQSVAGPCSRKVSAEANQSQQQRRSTKTKWAMRILVAFARGAPAQSAVIRSHDRAGRGQKSNSW